MPWILILYDAQADLAYWLYIQAYFERQVGFSLAQIGKTVTLYLPIGNILDQEAIRLFARYKKDVLTQVQGVIRHYD
jgi:hypothetical protein